jgi:hypothetical protein
MKKHTLHIEGVAVDLGTAFAALSVCVALAVVLDHEFCCANMETA